MKYKKNDSVVYTAHKHTTHPGPRAEHVEPQLRGEYYDYDVRKFWRVRDVVGNKVVVVTRTGKEHILDASDPALRKATFWERVKWIFFEKKFPALFD